MNFIFAVACAYVWVSVCLPISTIWLAYIRFNMVILFGNNMRIADLLMPKIHVCSRAKGKITLKFHNREKSMSWNVLDSECRTSNNFLELSLTILLFLAERTRLHIPHLVTLIKDTKYIICCRHDCDYRRQWPGIHLSHRWACCTNAHHTRTPYTCFVNIIIVLTYHDRLRVCSIIFPVPLYGKLLN